MGFNLGKSFGGLARGLERLVGGKAADVSKDLLKTTDLGYDTFGSGNALTDAEIKTLHGYGANYSDLLRNPLGTGPNSATGIFGRARGALTDTATQRAGAFSARLGQRGLTSNLSPEAISQLEAENQRGINQDLFSGNAAISDAEAQLTLSETSKLFDRMEGISKTILGVGESRSARGLQALFNALGLRLNRNQAIAQTISSTTSHMGGGGSSAGQTNPIG